MNHSPGNNARADSQNIDRQIDSVVEEFEAAWTAGQDPRIEDVLAGTVEVPAEELLPRLIPIELKQLQARNIFPDYRSYYHRFPAHTNLIETVFSDYSNTVSPTQQSSPQPAESLDTFSFVASSQTDLAGGEQFWNRDDELSGRQNYAIGDYQILDVLGQGGMGIVYRAYQKSADRIVALKVIRPERLEHHGDEKRSQIELRFQTEARSVARLQHDNLLQVYDVGESNGVHYFSMQYVEGKSLSQIVRKAPLSNQKAADYLEKIARAVAEAHRNGILHRDLKPENILVDTRTDRPLLADFGLAKILEEDVSATTAGDVFGSPPYMSPEQAEDSASVTVSSDVYSLGATLYSMLTGRPPFQAATLVETLRQVMHDEPVAPRKLNPDIDLDLETICLKCLQKEQSRRYSSAEALADDLGRYLRREPVLARPLGRLSRAWRWCLRNKLAATLASVAALLLVGVFVSVTVAYVKVSHALNEAQIAQEQSDADFAELREAVDSVFTEISEQTLLNQPGMQQLRKVLLSKVLPYYLGFVNSQRNSPELQDKLGEAYFRVGYIQEHLGSLDEGVEAYRNALEIQKKLLAQSPNDPQMMQELGQTLNAQARIFHKLNRLDDAAVSYRDAIVCRNDLVQSAPGNDEYRRQFANSVMNLGIVLRYQGNFEAADQQFIQALSLRSGFESLGPDFRRDLSRGYYNRGDLRLEQQRLDEAVHEFEQAAELLESVLDEIPDSIEDRYSLALCRRLQGDAASSLYGSHREQYYLKLEEGDDDRAIGEWKQAMDDFQQAMNSHERALESQQILIYSNPAVPKYREEYANIELNLGRLYQDKGETSRERGFEEQEQENPEQAKERFIEANTNFLRAAELFTDASLKFAALREKSPQRFDYRKSLALAKSYLGLVMVRRTDADQTTKTRTLELLEEAQQIFQQLQTDFPDRRSEVDDQLLRTNEFLEELKQWTPPGSQTQV